VKVRNLDDAPEVTKVIGARLGAPYLVRSWQELNAHLFQSLRLERMAMFCILIFIVVVATFNIVSTLTMMVFEKKRSLSILRTMGATPKQIAAIFLWEGMAIGLFGVTMGTGLGLVVCWVLQRYPIIELPEYFYDRTLPVIINPESIAIVAGTAIVIVLFGSLAPARKAATLTPIQGIREG
jgi:lipoprotein-releasing system permease protein